MSSLLSLTPPVLVLFWRDGSAIIGLLCLAVWMGELETLFREELLGRRRRGSISMSSSCCGIETGSGEISRNGDLAMIGAGAGTASRLSSTCSPSLGFGVSGRLQ